MQKISSKSARNSDIRSPVPAPPRLRGWLPSHLGVTKLKLARAPYGYVLGSRDPAAAPPTSGWYRYLV